MKHRLILTLTLLLTLSFYAYADGLAFGKGFTPQLRETHQLAVINLTESTADVAMFIAIENIPEGKEITYILPFWYQPEGFSMTEGAAKGYRDKYVLPAQERVRRMQRISSHRASSSIIETAPFICVGATAILFPVFGSRSMGGGGISMLTPYSTAATPHARAELYRIGENDLQQLIKQSGLPEKYIEPLKKYKTPYFAVMRLKGLPKMARKECDFGGAGVTYHFTHHIPDGKYVYPLGTGAAWPTPIPITEVYITCPEDMAMEVKAPVVGAREKWYSIPHAARELANYHSLSPLNG